MNTLRKMLLHTAFLWRSAGTSNEKCEPTESQNIPKMFFEKTQPHLKIESFKFLPKTKISCTHESIVNV